MRAVLALLLATASAFRAPLPTRVRAAPRAALPDTLLLLAEATADTKATVTEAVGAEVYGPIFFGGCVPRARARPGGPRARAASASSSSASAARRSPRCSSTNRTPTSARVPGARGARAPVPTYSRAQLADDFMAEGKRELEAEFGVEATEAVLSGKTPARPAAAAPAAESAPDEDGYDD